MKQRTYTRETMRRTTVTQIAAWILLMHSPSCWLAVGASTSPTAVGTANAKHVGAAVGRVPLPPPPPPPIEEERPVHGKPMDGTFQVPPPPPPPETDTADSKAVSVPAVITKHAAATDVQYDRIQRAKQPPPPKESQRPTQEFPIVPPPPPVAEAIASHVDKQLRPNTYQEVSTPPPVLENVKSPPISTHYARNSATAVLPREQWSDRIPSSATTTISTKRPQMQQQQQQYYTSQPPRQQYYGTTHQVPQQKDQPSSQQQYRGIQGPPRYIGPRPKQEKKTIRNFFKTVTSGVQTLSNTLDKNLDTVMDRTTSALQRGTALMTGRVSGKGKTEVEPSWTKELPPPSRQQVPPKTGAKLGPLTGPVMDAARFQKPAPPHFDDSDSEAEGEEMYPYVDGRKNKTTLAAVQLRNGGDHAGGGNETLRRATGMATPPPRPQQPPPYSFSDASLASPPRQQQPAELGGADTQAFPANGIPPGRMKEGMPGAPDRRTNYDAGAAAQRQDPAWQRPQQQQYASSGRGLPPGFSQGTSVPPKAREPPKRTGVQYDRTPYNDEDMDDTLLRRIKRTILRELPEMILSPFQAFYSKLFYRGDDGRAYVSMSSGYHYDEGWVDDETGTTASGNRIARAFGFGSKGKFAAKPKSFKTQQDPSSWGKKKGSLNDPSSVAPTKVVDLVSTVHIKQGSTAIKSYPLISPEMAARCKAIGRNQAFTDLVALGFSLMALFQLLPYISTTPSVLSGESLATFTSSVVHSLVLAMHETWAPFALCAAWLTVAHSHVEFKPIIRKMKKLIEEAVAGSTEYAQLWLRLVTSVDSEASLSDDASQIATSQIEGIVARRRLRFYTIGVLSGILLVAYGSTFAPIGKAWVETIQRVIEINSIRQWPIELSTIMRDIESIGLPLIDVSRTLAEKELAAIIENPVKIAVQASVPAAILSSSFLPGLARALSHKVFVDAKANKSSLKVSDAETPLLHRSHVASLGSSSSSRLQLLSQDAVEVVLERWQMLQPSIRSPGTGMSKRDSSFTFVTVQKWALILIAGVTLALPLLLHVIYGTKEIQSLSYLSQICLVLLSTFVLTKRAIHWTMTTPPGAPAVIAFVTSLSIAIDELLSIKKAPQVDLRLAATASPTKGIHVSDLWAAHSAKRAWAVQGANLQCRSGEVVLILGDEGSGKTRLLTAIAEILLEPPKRARSTTVVRGKVNVGGIDSSQWDRDQLKNRVGVVLNDVGCVAKAAELVSGSSLEEILDPSGTGSAGQPGREKNAVGIALQLTGLSTSLLPRLPSKLSTVVTTHEDEINPSLPARPLSPSEWNKIFLTRALARCIMNNDNPMSSHDSPAKCMIGTVLLLDEVMSPMSEIEEKNLIKRLKKSGASVLLSSSRWALGRFADRILVLKNGVEVESGTHAELLSLGKIYASQWNVMTS